MNKIFHFITKRLKNLEFNNIADFAFVITSVLLIAMAIWGLIELGEYVLYEIKLLLGI